MILKFIRKLFGIKTRISSTEAVRIGRAALLGHPYIDESTEFLFSEGILYFTVYCKPHLELHHARINIETGEVKVVAPYPR